MSSLLHRYEKPFEERTFFCTICTQEHKTTFWLSKTIKQHKSICKLQTFKVCEVCTGEVITNVLIIMLIGVFLNLVIEGKSWVGR